MTAFNFPIAAFYKNIIFTTQRKAFAMYKLSAAPHNFFPEDRQRMCVGSFEEMLSGFEGRGQILLLWEDAGIDEGRYYNRCINQQNTDDTDIKTELSRHTQAVKGAVFDARVLRRYIIFELPVGFSISSLQEILLYARDQALKAYLAMRPMELPPSIRQEITEAESAFYSRMKRFGLNRTVFSDLDFMIRKCSQRFGVLPPPLPDREQGAMTPAAIASFTDGDAIDEHVNYVALTDGFGKTQYQSFLHFVDLPQRMPTSGINLFSTAEFNFPFDAVIHFEITASHKASKKVESQKRILIGQMGEAYSAGESASIGEQTGIQGSRSLEAKLDQGKSLAKVSICLAVSHSDKKEVSSYASQLQTYFLRRTVRAVRPVSIQLESLMSFLPGSLPCAPSIECDPGFIAAMGPHFDTELGDPHGFYTGWTGQSPVFWKPGRSALELNKTNAIAITGNLGGGKSTLAKLLAYFILLSGGYVLAIDPKDEYWVFRHLFPDQVKTIDLTPRGGAAINPFILSQQENRAKGIAMDYLTLAFNASMVEARRLAISQGLERLFKRPAQERYMDNFRVELEYLAVHGSDDIKQEAQRNLFLLQLLKESDVGQMVFGEDNIRLFDQGQRMGVLNIQEIPRPLPSTPFERFTESERQGVAIIYLLAAIARETAFGLPRHLIKGLLMDECHVMTSISEGERLIDECIRIGRTFNLIPILMSQNMSDLDKPSFINNIGQIFCFRSESSEESKRNLAVLKADEDAVRPETFAALPSGTCVFKDADNRIGWLEVDPQPAYLLKLFDTKPDAKIQKI